MSDEARLQVVEYLRAQIFGPVGGPHEVLDQDEPQSRYLVGVLYPRLAGTKQIEEEEILDPDSGSADVAELPDDPVSLTNQWMPSSVGLSFVVEGDGNLDVRVGGARYEESTDSDAGWMRVPLTEDGEFARIRTELKQGFSDHLIWEGGASIRQHVRPLANGLNLVTVTLVNEHVMDDSDRVTPTECLFQIALECSAVDGRIVEYPSFDLLDDNPEDRELQLMYRDRCTFAVGHGCAVNWEDDLDSTRPCANRVWVDFIPTYDVPPVVTRESSANLDALRISVLASRDSDWDAILEQMQGIVDEYEQWADGLTTVVADVPEHLVTARQRLMGRIELAASRMRLGIARLQQDPACLEAFRLANAAMLMQMRHSKADLGGTKRSAEEHPDVSPDYGADCADYRWYPFQLAFMLLTLDSLADDQHPDRELVDLLWFPTGGGKTEAYLLGAAFVMLHRRLKYGEHGTGTAVITRYTLRLLTSQQFERAATLTCALEFLRRRDSQLGDTPFSIGLWVGSETVPNSYQKAREAYQAMREEDRPGNRFQVQRCPWCGTEIVPSRDAGERTGDWGLRVGDRLFEFFCPNRGCEFHDVLPMQVIDEALYDEPPSFLIGTIDKFARVVWEPKAGCFFGSDFHRGPDLIIQDELHLLSGPLGTMAGLYESGVDLLASLRGVAPKVIASTATVRQAGDQIRALFAKKVQVFPPSGLSADDSFFARVDRETAGRLYVGLMAPSHTAQTTLVHVSASLLQSVVDLELERPERDSYWTLVVYHNSLRELGGMLTMAKDDIPARIRLIAPTEEAARELEDTQVVELTGNLPGWQIPTILNRMELHDDDPEGVSVLLATNMLSVGIDIKRLGLMLVDGQPKTTSEYIQATSRVGRSTVPGLVFAYYSGQKPRDRSHYEMFRPYHAALYRFVEPTSVTPYALPARDRAAHAVLVMSIRHGLGIAANDRADDILDHIPAAQRVVERIVERVQRVDPDEANSARQQLESALGQWVQKATVCRERGRRLYYESKTRNQEGLLKHFYSYGPGWETLDSMRNGDRTCQIRVKQARNG